MNVYTIRRENDLEAVVPCLDLEGAVSALNHEALAHAVHPAPGSAAVLQLVITEDADDGSTGEVVVRYAAGPARR